MEETKLARRDWDLIIIGGGVAGLSAAINAKLEGLDVLVIDSLKRGGNFKNSYQIRNYLGFPKGITGRELSELAYEQAVNVGVIFALDTVVDVRVESNIKHCGIKPERRIFEVKTKNGQAHSKSILITTGTECNKLSVPGLKEYLGKGIYYHSDEYPLIKELLPERNANVFIIGGGNAAAQAATFFSESANANVTILLKDKELSDSMAYCWRMSLENAKNISICPLATIERFNGYDCLSGIAYSYEKNGRKIMVNEQTNLVLIFAGGTPTCPCSGLEMKDGFIVTDNLFRTSTPGVFAAGDIRLGSNKQIISAAGEGAAAIPHVISYLKENDIN